MLRTIQKEASQEGAATEANRNQRIKPNRTRADPLRTDALANRTGFEPDEGEPLRTKPTAICSIRTTQQATEGALRVVPA